MLDATNSAALAREITEDEAREYLCKLETAGEKRPILDFISTDWNWSRSRTHRFIAKWDGRRETEPPPPVRDLLLAAAAEYDRKNPGANASDNIRRDLDGGSKDEPTRGARDQNLVLAEQPATWVYANNSGGITIEQDGAHLQNDDQLIIVRPEHLPVLIRSLQLAAQTLVQEA